MFHGQVGICAVIGAPESNVSVNKPSELNDAPVKHGQAGTLDLQNSASVMDLIFVILT
jgi:hypothetical protein